MGKGCYAALWGERNLPDGAKRHMAGRDATGGAQRASLAKRMGITHAQLAISTQCTCLHFKRTKTFRATKIIGEIFLILRTRRHRKYTETPLPLLFQSAQTYRHDREILNRDD